MPPGRIAHPDATACVAGHRLQITVVPCSAVQIVPIGPGKTRLQHRRIDVATVDEHPRHHPVIAILLHRFDLKGRCGQQAGQDLGRLWPEALTPRPDFGGINAVQADLDWSAVELHPEAVAVGDFKQPGLQDGGRLISQGATGQHDQQGSQETRRARGRAEKPVHPAMLAPLPALANNSGPDALAELSQMAVKHSRLGDAHAASTQMPESQAERRFRVRALDEEGHQLLRTTVLMIVEPGQNAPPRLAGEHHRGARFQLPQHCQQVRLEVPEEVVQIDPAVQARCLAVGKMPAMTPPYAIAVPVRVRLLARGFIHDRDGAGPASGMGVTLVTNWQQRAVDP